MGKTAGWSIWGKTGDKVRQFTASKAVEADAISLLKATHPKVEVLSRHSMDASTIKFLKMAEGRIVEWVPLNPKDKLKARGVPIDKPMK